MSAKSSHQVPGWWAAAIVTIVPLAGLGMLVAWLASQPPALSDLQKQWAREAQSPGWHVVSGILYHDGAYDEAGTERMTEEISALGDRQKEMESRLDDSFQAARDDVYRKYEQGGGSTQ
jgi:hypothetical protein